MISSKVLLEPQFPHLQDGKNDICLQDYWKEKRNTTRDKVEQHRAGLGKVNGPRCHSQEGSIFGKGIALIDPKVSAD